MNYFFFKVFPCRKDSNNKLNPSSHNEKNCYFYHELIEYENGIKKIIEKDRRREVISLTLFFKKLRNEMKENDNFIVFMESVFELKKNDKFLNYYIDCLPFQKHNEDIFYDLDYCQNETEFNYHINRYKTYNCNHYKMFGNCKNKFCYYKHASNAKNNENEKNIDEGKKNDNNNNDLDEGIIHFKNVIDKWKDKKEIQLKEIIEIYEYILSFDNKYLSKIQINEDIKHYFYNPFYKLYQEFNNKNTSQNSLSNNINNNILKYQNEENISNERIIQGIYNQFNSNNNTLKIYKNSDLFQLLESLNITQTICYLSAYNSIKLSEVVKYAYAMLNSCDGVIIYGCNEDNKTLKGIKLERKERDDFKKWFNTEFFKLLIQNEETIKYKIYDLTNNNNDECILIIEVKQIKFSKLLRTYSSQQCFIINDEILKKKNKEKYLILKNNDVSDLNTKEYIDLLRKRLLFYYSNKFGININIH